MIIVAPLIEEFLFRGLMLHKWSIKWNIKKAILFSELEFTYVIDYRQQVELMLSQLIVVIVISLAFS